MANFLPKSVSEGLLLKAAPVQLRLLPAETSTTRPKAFEMVIRQAPELVKMKFQYLSIIYSSTQTCSTCITQRPKLTVHACTHHRKHCCFNLPFISTTFCQNQKSRLPRSWCIVVGSFSKLIYYSSLLESRNIL